MSVGGSSYSEKNQGQAQRIKSGSLLPQLPNWNSKWDVGQYRLELESFHRKLLEYIRRMDADIAQAIYLNTPGDTIQGQGGGSEVVNNWDIDSLVRVFNSGQGRWTETAIEYDTFWFGSLASGGSSTVPGLGSQKVLKVIATPGGQPAPDDSSISSWIAVQKSGATISGTFTSAICNVLLIDRLVDVASLSVPLKISTDGAINAISLNGGSSLGSHAAPTNKQTFTITGWRYGVNTLDVNFGGAGTTTGILLEWGTPTW